MDLAGNPVPTIGHHVSYLLGGNGAECVFTKHFTRFRKTFLEHEVGTEKKVQGCLS